MNERACCFIFIIPHSYFIISSFILTILSILFRFPAHRLNYQKKI
jgi:hypothetical protein